MDEPPVFERILTDQTWREVVVNRPAGSADRRRFAPANQPCISFDLDQQRLHLVVVGDFFQCLVAGWIVEDQAADGDLGHVVLLAAEVEAAAARQIEGGRRKARPEVLIRVVMRLV